jgi:hypothetical protein
MPNTDTRFLAVLSVKNEGAFLLDWLAHHRTCGFTDFLVFSNDCADGTDTMLDRLATMGWLTHVRNDGPHPKGPQWEALRRADTHPLRATADWVLVLDIDEYVNIHAGGGTLPALLAALPEATAIPLTWRLFGNAGLRDFVDRPITDQFTHAAPAVMGWPWRAALFKTLFRDDGSYGRLGVHRPRQPDRARMATQRWFDGSGRALPPQFRTGRIFSDYGRDNYRLAQINHYALGAMESYVLKADRGRANRDASAFDLSYWVERNFSTDEDRSIQRRAPQVAALRSDLGADTVLGALHSTAVAWRKDRFLRLMEEESYRSLIGRLMLAPPSAPLTVEQHRFLTRFARPAASAAAHETDQGQPSD